VVAIAVHIGPAVSLNHGCPSPTVIDFNVMALRAACVGRRHNSCENSKLKRSGCFPDLAQAERRVCCRCLMRINRTALTPGETNAM